MKQYKNLNYFFIENILSKEECDSLISKTIAQKKLNAMGVVSHSKDNPHSTLSESRSANGCWLEENCPLIKKIKNLVAGITGLPVENQEAPNFLKYEVGGEYKAHMDAFDPKNENYNLHTNHRGGNRVFTSIIYLNEDFEGGETDFPLVGLKVKPTIGSVFTWKNLKSDKTLEPNSKHAGLPVKSGTKYAIVIWTREQKFNCQYNNPFNFQMPNWKLSHTKEQFEQLGYTSISNFIDQKTCEDFAKEMFFLKNSNKLSPEKRKQMAYQGDEKTNDLIDVFSYGHGGVEKFNSYLKFISKNLADQVGVKWKDSHCYARIYYNGAILGKHVDRKGLDYTLSVNVFSTLKKDWPLYCIDKQGNQIAAGTGSCNTVGEGVLILGTKLLHWREPLICAPDECSVQLFFHWSDLETKNEEIAEKKIETKPVTEAKSGIIFY